MSAIYFILRWAALVALLLAINALYGCGHAPSGLRFTYHGTTELQGLMFDCVLENMSSLGIEASGDIWMVDYIAPPPGSPDDWTVYGRTTGRDDFLRIDTLPIPALPQVLAHELVHVLAGQETGDRDSAHVNPHYFGSNSLAELYMYQAYSLCQR